MYRYGFNENSLIFKTLRGCLNIFQEDMDIMMPLYDIRQI